VVFNYLGQLGGSRDGAAPFVAAGEAVGLERDGRGAQLYTLEVNGAVSEGRLEIAITYDSRRHREATIRGLLHAFLASLREILAHCRSVGSGEHTPSDFPLAHLDQEQLQRVSALLDGLDLPSDGALAE
jgi:non-ribosomal peptide synthase protein (TIGR01720 family)